MSVEPSDRIEAAHVPGAEVIERLDDTRLAPYTRVADAEWLQARGLFVAEGRLVVRRLIDDRRFAIHSVLVTPAAYAALGDTAARAGAPVYICPPATLNALTGFNFHRGCLALAHRGPEGVPLDSMFGEPLLVGLEAVGNPDNVGGIFRSALALHAGGIILDETSGDPLYRKAIRTSMAASLRVPFARIGTWADERHRLRGAGFTIVALTPSPDAVDIAAFAQSRPDGPLLLLAGHEGAGLTGDALTGADVRCRIPVDARSDSLNVAVAVAIALAVLSVSSRSA